MYKEFAILQHVSSTILRATSSGQVIAVNATCMSISGYNYTLLHVPYFFCIVAQRTFVQHPQDFTVYLVQADGGGTIREAAAFNCELNTLDYGTRPNITWEINNGGNISSVELMGRLVPFQYDHTGYLQIHSPVDGDNGSQVRCVAADPANPDDPVVESDWATVIISGKVSFVCKMFYL